MQTPIAFIIFNRPNTTGKVFDVIRKVKPSKLLVVADGPRAERPGEADKCAATRAIIKRVDWECEILTNYSDVNLGCRKRVSSGLDWVFNTVEEAIIIEDDCLPDPTFFRFCEELLDYYREDKRIMTICGSNFQFGHRRTEDSYYFSRYNNVWGWASWKRAWQHYDVEMSLWPMIRDGKWIKDILSNNAEKRYWESIFQSTYENSNDTWDYQLKFACWVQSGLSILPNVNLVSNIGYHPVEATHTKDNKWGLANLPVEAMSFPIRHPQSVICSTEADSLEFQKIMRPNLLNRLQRKANSLFVK